MIERKAWPPDAAINSVYLRIDHWNDYSYVTSFEVIAFDQSGVKFELPSVRIGFLGQTTQTPTYQKIEPNFERLPDEFFSLGMNVEFYRALANDFDEEWLQEFRQLYT